jgi:hypothetical protein
MVSLTEKFLKGLEEYGMTYDEIKNWRYCGGDYEGHITYYYLIFNKSKKLPEFSDECVCGHKIEKNNYICDKKKSKIMVLGMCCIKKFIPFSSRTCEDCDKPHKNRIINKCNDCRIKKCIKCNQKNTNINHDICKDCLIGHCSVCYKIINPKYKKCFKHKDEKIKKS